MENSILERFHLPYHDPKDAIIIGVDFGDGEYAAAQAFVSEDEDEDKVDLDLNDRLVVDNDRASTEFAVYGVKKSDGQVTGEGVGKTYVEQDAVALRGSSYANFKRPPGKGPGTSSEIYQSGPLKSLNDYTYGHLMSHAFSRLVDTILKSNKFLEKAAERTGTTHVYLFVGRPSSARWEETEQAYADMLAQNLKTYPNIALHVAVVSEAKAAMASEYFAYRKKKASARGGGGPDIQKETIAITDGGSSTFDCVVVRDGRVICEYSRQIGAGKLDKNLLDIQLFSGETVRDCAARLNLKYIPPENEEKLVTEASVATRIALREAIFAQRDVNGKPRLGGGMGKALVSLREVKENYFGPNGDDGTSDASYNLYYTSETGVGRPTNLPLQFHYDLPQAIHGMAVPVEPSYTEEDPYGGHAYVECPSFEAALEAFYRGARAAWERNGVEKPDRVIVTGGATLMPFVNEIMERVFETKERGIAVSPPSGNRHYSVSTGVAYICFVELYKEKIYREVCKECDDYVQAIKGDLKAALVEAVTNYEWDDCLSWVDAWANDPKCTTMATLNNLPHKAPPGSWDSYVTKEVKNCVEANLKGKVQDYLKKKTEKMFPDAKKFSFKLNTVSLAKASCRKPVLTFTGNLFHGDGLLGRISQRLNGVPLLNHNAFISSSAKQVVVQNVKNNKADFRRSIRNQMVDMNAQADEVVEAVKRNLRLQMESYVEQLDDFFIREDFNRG